MILDNARKWGNENTHLLSRTVSTYISLTDLINKGYIEQDELKDPRNREVMSGCVEISYNASNNKYKYIYDDRECIELDNYRNMTAAHPQYMCYNFDESTGTIVKYDVNNTDCLTDVVIPNKINGVVVKHIGNAAFINATEQRCYSSANPDGVVMPNTYVRNDLDGFEDGCWFDCHSSNIDITSVVFPKTLETIGTSAFTSMLITNLDFSNFTSLTRISDDAFYGNVISNIDFTNTPNLQSIGAWTFDNNSLVNLDLRTSTSLKALYPGAFKNNNIFSLYLPNSSSLKTIRYEAFEYNKITKVTIPASVVTIEAEAFKDNNWNSVTILHNEINSIT